jgi:hypothetical protein
MLAPAHPRPAFEDIDHALEVPVVVRSGLGVGVDLNRARPDLLRPDPGEIDCGGAVHAGCLRGVRVELIARDHLDAVRLPIDRLVPLLLAHIVRPVRFGSRPDMVP